MHCNKTPKVQTIVPAGALDVRAFRPWQVDGPRRVAAARLPAKGGLADVGVGAALVANGGRRAVAGEDSHVVGESPEFLADTLDKPLEAAAKEIGAPAPASHQDIAAKESFFREPEKAQAAGAVAREIEHRELDA